MVRGSRRTEAWLLLTFAIAINALLIYGFISRPIIAYHLTTPLGYNETTDLGSSELQVVLEAMNRGRSPARLDFQVRIYNLSLIGPEDMEISTTDQFSLVRIPLEESILASEIKMIPITIENDRDADYLVLIFSLETRLSLNPVEGFFSSFEVHEPERPTALLLKRVETGVYKRVTQR